MLRHAAALALVGWYLMVPPRVDPNGRPLLEPPLARWIQGHSFDTAADCETFKRATITNSENGLYDSALGALGPAESARFHDGIKHSLCVSSDDPRLKPK
jgi:hypothetical protein